MQENNPSESNTGDDHAISDSEQNDQPSTDPGQAQQTQDTAQEQPPASSTDAPRLSWQSGSSASSTPSWLRTESESGSSASSTSTPRLSWQSGSAGSVREMYRRRTYYDAPERGGCLTAWLILWGIGSILGILLSFVVFGASDFLGLLVLVNGILALAGVIGTWQFKRWGYYLLMTLCSINLIINLISLFSGGGTSTSGGSIVGEILGILILYLLVREKWEEFA
ncbi:MAG TPA: hypothetical protein VH593_28975 [Ktedonobacteraceae bacterium]